MNFYKRISITDNGSLNTLIISTEPIERGLHTAIKHLSREEFELFKSAVIHTVESIQYDEVTKNEK